MALCADDASWWSCCNSLRLDFDVVLLLSYCCFGFLFFIVKNHFDL